VPRGSSDDQAPDGPRAHVALCGSEVLPEDPQPDFRALFEHTPACFLVLNPALTIVAVSDEYLVATMTERDEIVDKSVFDVFPDNPDDHDADGVSSVRASFERVISTGVAEAMPKQKFDIQRSESEGGGFEVRYWSLFNSPVLDRDGSVAFLIQRVADITDSVCLEELAERQARTLRYRDEQFEAAQRIALMGSWEYRPAEATFTVSDGLRRVFGLADDFVVAGLDGFLELVHPEDRERVRSTIDEATRGRLPREVEYRIIRPDGVERRMHGRRELVWQGATVVAVRAVTQDVTENRQLEAERQRLLEQVETLARTDALTGLRNRRGWDEDLRVELARAARNGDILAVAMVDLDCFKDFNDNHGHLAGDELLKDAAIAWRRNLRATDVLARYGGEEFALALPSRSRQAATATLGRLNAATPAQQTVSGGIVTWDREETAEALMQRADQALYKAKHTGRNRIIDAQDNPRTRDRL
jgi:diguanylate cyclase (GGDEF)-like protein/PAS domain S-box-containing protein